MHYLALSLDNNSRLKLILFCERKKKEERKYYTYVLNKGKIYICTN